MQVTQDLASDRPAGLAVEVEDLVKHYRGADTNALNGVSFDVRPGQFFTLLGPNGAGKTTTVAILTTTLRPTSGTARVAGHDVARDPGGVRRRAGIIFQSPSLDLNLTAEENVRFHAILYGLYPYRPAYRFMPSAYRARVRELADVLDIGGDLFRPLRTFSGGMKRKLEIVRSLLHSPSVLFLDEPTTGLDPASRRNLWSYLRSVLASGGTTLVLTTHYLEEAEDSDVICILNHGQVVATGSPRQVKAALVDEYVLIDAADRAALRSELETGRHRFTEDRHIRIDVAGKDVHAFLRSIQSPLTVIETHAPSLEDAYLAIVTPHQDGQG